MAKTKAKHKKVPGKKSTIIFFALAVFWAAVNIYDLGYDDDPDHEGNLYWTDATYVEDAKSHPENEGKLIAISGKLVSTSSCYDELVDVTFDAPRVDRHVEKLAYRSFSKEWVWEEVYAGKGVDGYEGKMLGGSLMVGDFTLDPDFTIQFGFDVVDAQKSDFSQEDIERLESEGYHFQNGTQLWVSQISSSALNTKKYDSDYEGSYRMRWTISKMSGDGNVTVVGYQNGDTLELCEDMDALSVKDEYMDEEEFNKKAIPPHRNKGAAIMMWCFSALFLILGIRNVILIRKAKAQGEALE